MDRPAKLARLNNFRRKLPHVTAKALEAVLRTVKEEGVPELHDRDQMREARDLENHVATPYGPIMQSVEVITKSCRTQTLPIAHPFALLWASVETSPRRQALLADRVLALSLIHI